MAALVIPDFEQTISRNLGSLGPSEAIHANNFQNPYLTKNPDALQGRVLQPACVAQLTELVIGFATST